MFVLVRAIRQLTATDVTVAPEVAESLHALVALGDQFQASSVSCAARWKMRRTGSRGYAMARWAWRWCRYVELSLPSPSWCARWPAHTGKDVRLRLVGEDVELDTRVLDGVADALRHLVTNAVDHGCESPSERSSARVSLRRRRSPSRRELPDRPSSSRLPMTVTASTRRRCGCRPSSVDC